MTSEVINYLQDPMVSNEVDTLYHYTSTSGLLGVLSRRGLWATSIDYMEDRQDFLDGLRMFLCSVEARAQTSVDDLERMALQRMADEIHGTRFTNVAIICLSENRDDAQLWQSCRNSGGAVAIGFSMEALRSVARTCDLWLAPCMYAADRKQQAIDETIDALLDGYKLNVKNGKPSLPAFVREAMRLAPLFKPEQRNHENEWRLVSGSLPSTVPNLSFRVSDQGLTPYYEVSLQAERQMLIRELIAGPTPDADRKAHALRSLLLNVGMQAAVSSSGVPA